MNGAVTDPIDAYVAALGEYFRTHSEESLYRASLLSRTFVEEELGPEEIIALHVEALPQALVRLPYREQARASSEGLQFLLEVMIAYGIQYREYLDMKHQERAREAARAAPPPSDREELLAAVAHELRQPLLAV